MDYSFKTTNEIKADLAQIETWIRSDSEEFGDWGLMQLRQNAADLRKELKRRERAGRQ